MILPVVFLPDGDEDFAGANFALTRVGLGATVLGQLPTNGCASGLAVLNSP